MFKACWRWLTGAAPPPNQFLVFTMRRELYYIEHEPIYSEMVKCDTFVYMDDDEHCRRALEWLIDRQRFGRRMSPKIRVWQREQIAVAAQAYEDLHFRFQLTQPDGWVIGFYPEQLNLGVEFKLMWG